MKITFFVSYVYKNIIVSTKAYLPQTLKTALTNLICMNFITEKSVFFIYSLNYILWDYILGEFVL